MHLKRLKILQSALLNRNHFRNITTSSNFTNVTLKHGGKLEGEEIRGQITGNSYLSWKGIPYAEPPIERLRFKAPVPHKGWSGTRDATKHGHICIQHIPGQQSHVVGDEDCLYMNVYTPKLRAKNEPYPVMVWIHGGAFTFGSGNSETFNPELFVNEDVIVVTLNYRLGVLGFLSTEDQNAQGNYGLKDILLAGEWIKNNIDIFGGDPNQITYFGESGGAMMIHDLLISPLGKGLFQRAIMQSGTSLSPLFLQDRPLEKATELAKRLNLKYKSSKELVEELLRVDATILAQNVPSWMQKEIPQGKLPLSFCPTIEPEDSLEPRLLTEHPLKTLLKNEYTKIPMLIGVNSEEGLYAVTELQNEPGLFHVLNDEPNHLLPPSWNIDPNSSTAQEYFQQIQKIYFDNKPIKNVCDYVRFISDSQWNYGPYKTTRIQVTQQTAPIFFNVFSFSGDLSNIKKKRKLMDYEGVIHGDDVPYLFPMSKYDPPILKIDNPAFKVRARMVRLWANFAKHGNPTNNLDELVDVKWPKVTENDFKYMEIGSQLNVKTDPFGDRMKLWWDMDSKFN